MPLARAAEYGFINARCHSMRSKLISYERLTELASSQSIGELYSSLEETPYAPFISSVSAQGIHQGLSKAFAFERNKIIRGLKKSNQEIFKLFFEKKYALLDEKTKHIRESRPEDTFCNIDKEYIILLKKSLLQLPPKEQGQLKKIMGSYFDLLNLYNLVKFRLLYNHSIEETLSYMFPYTHNFNIDELSLLCHLKSLKQLSIKMEPILGKRFDSYESFRSVLYAYHKKQLLAVWSSYPFSISIPFSLLRLIEIEISDLRSITAGVSFDINKNEIIQMIVGG
ncbi:MAG: hypothetical protein COA44_05360 [Arcobacter sp.]|nr:MAG: hypothetical protein COA44_05360 [Arcobacter sp.]